ncbi:MAG: hypothetical protein IJR35_02045 [Synergistaceae bacterium]|nr:hypothetical protein [Synergistaceae bacterium]MBR0203413.1 hypothetical protein [Synergistaceae bacterium]
MADSVNDIYRAGFYKGMKKGRKKGFEEGRKEGIHEGRIEIINTIGGLYYAGIDEGTEKGIKEEYERASQAFAEGVKILQSLGATPEDIAKFQTLYPPPILLLNDDDCD